MWLFFTLLAAVFWGIGQIIIKKGLSNIPPLFNNVLAAILIPVFMIPYTLYHGVNFDQVWSILPLTALVAVMFLSYYYVIGIGQVAFTSTIIGTAPAVVVLLSLLFLKESPTTTQTLAIPIILIGTTLLALPEKVNNIRTLKMGGWFWWAAGTAILLGFADFLIKLLINQSDVYTYLFTYCVCLIVVSGISIFFDPKGRTTMPAFNLKQYLPTLIGVTIMEIAFVSFHFALADGLASVVAPVSSIYVAITAILAWIFLKEKIDKIHFVGIALAAVGVVLVGIA
jgi:uncharacterized membrane protein